MRKKKWKRDREKTDKKQKKRKEKKKKNMRYLQKKAWNTTKNKEKAVNIYLQDRFCTALSSSNQSITQEWTSLSLDNL